MSTPHTPYGGHWEHGKRSHGFWTEQGARLAMIGLPPRFAPKPIVYGWYLDSEPYTRHEAKSLDHAKRQVIKALRMQEARGPEMTPYEEDELRIRENARLKEAVDILNSALARTRQAYDLLNTPATLAPPTNPDGTPFNGVVVRVRLDPARAREIKESIVQLQKSLSALPMQLSIASMKVERAVNARKLDGTSWAGERHIPPGDTFIYESPMIADTHVPVEWPKKEGEPE